MAVEYFGRNNDGDDTYNNEQEVFAGRFENTAGTGNITEIGYNCAYFWAGDPVTVDLGIYADDAGVIGALISDVGTVSVTSTGWFTKSGLSVAVTSGTYYWLATRTTAPVKVAMLTDGGADQGILATDSTPGLPDPFPVVHTHKTWSPCLRAGVEAGGEDVTPTPTEITGTFSQPSPTVAIVGPAVGAYVSPTIIMGW